ncbi:MAG TPA: ABC transporter permease [Bacteroidales bacterium]|nr:ABC transporter permease [Bacteroidales bacterium]
MKWLSNIKESFYSSLSTLRVNKLRTFLTLFGITIGIFAIISVFTVIDSLEKTIRQSLSSLGDDIIYVQKWPWTPPPGEEYAWWEYLKRPLPTFQEFRYLQDKSELTRAVAFQVNSTRSASYRSQSLKEVTLLGISHEYEKIRTFNYSDGRYFAPVESHQGSNVAILGHGVATELFPGVSPLGKRINLGGHKAMVIGQLKKEGSGVLAGGSMDDVVLIPLNYARRFIDITRERTGPTIIVRALQGVHLQELIYDTERLMRSVRKLQPMEKENFSINRASLISRNLDQLFGVINVAGWLIGGFSIIVGGFGIANIMFVSVKERTHIIGIQKALGARNHFILSEFLFEAVILALIGGTLGLLLILLGSLIANQLSALTIQLTMANILLGLSISAAIGIIAGFAPARSASRLNPVDAINTTF